MIDNLFKRLSLALVGLSTFAFCFLTLPFSFAEDNDTIVDDVIITVPAACSIKDSTGGAGKTYNVSMMPGQYNPNIGSTTIVATCNDASGFALYAIGYGNEEYGNTDLITNLANPGTSGTNTGNIVTGTATSGGTSNWAMKLSTPTNSNPNPTYPITIQNGFDGFSAVPSTYTLVAKRTSATDAGTGAEGARLDTHYAVYVSPTQVAATYTGKVKYDIVHPNNADPPEDPRFVAKLDTGQNVNVKLKTLAGVTSPSYSTQDNTISALKRANALPSGFTPSTANTISTSDSALPIHAWYDSSDTTIYYYSEANRIYMNEDSSNFFREMRALSDLSTIATWNTSNVTNMSYMFYYAGYNATTFNLDLSSWNTASVTDMSYMFSSAGRNATTFALDLSSWNMASVTSMTRMFSGVGYSATTLTLDLSSWNLASVTSIDSVFYNAGYSVTSFTLDLSSWNTASVTNMSRVFSGAGYSATTWSVHGLSSWNTASVTNMTAMFQYAGYNANSFTLDLSSWSTAKVTDMSDMFYSAGYSATTWSVHGLSSWNTASVRFMTSMFRSAGYNATTFTLDLSSWNTASVTNMLQMFYYAGYSATTWSVGDLSSWNTANVGSVRYMFSYAGYNANTFDLDLSSWNTASVTNMLQMFYYAGYSATTFALNLSSWNTASVTNMSQMFSNAGSSATTWSVTIPKTNGAATPIANTTSNLYGKTASVTAAPPSGKSFTLAN